MPTNAAPPGWSVLATEGESGFSFIKFNCNCFFMSDNNPKWHYSKIKFPHLLLWVLVKDPPTWEMGLWLTFPSVTSTIGQEAAAYLHQQLRWTLAAADCSSGTGGIQKMIKDGHWASHWSETIMFIRPTEPSPAADRIKADEVIISELMLSIFVWMDFLTFMFTALHQHLFG